MGGEPVEEISAIQVDETVLREHFHHKAIDATPASTVERPFREVSMLWKTSGTRRV